MDGQMGMLRIRCLNSYRSKLRVSKIFLNHIENILDFVFYMVFIATT